MPNFSQLCVFCVWSLCKLHTDFKIAKKCAQLTKSMHNSYKIYLYFETSSS